MTTIQVDDFYVDWVKANVRPVLKDAGVRLSESAAELFAYAMEAQVKDGFVRDQEHAIRSAEVLVRYIKDGYWPQSPPFAPFGPRRSEVNFNVALHLMVDLNRIALAFPWNTTD